ncbi:sensor histidine kinase [Dactylosporangium sp. AC04546]|uniref:sensor histidine kinase n=1 Tax=Dactylosporangium sp. AC04546 TaxID=2862460 RepID=UPI001EE13C2B|nr:sensor histidine kinase [Dactylosporangium sp. AC04546]WVK78662.1 sensor histidine kinase [Dactylosporangium sp. AC04546]
MPTAVSRRPRSATVDRVAAAVLVVVALAQVLVFLPIAPPLIGALVAVCATAPIAWRRSQPVAAALVGSAVWLVPTDGFVLVGYIAAFLLFSAVTAEVPDPQLAAAIVLIGTVFSIIGTAEQPAHAGDFVGAVVGVLAPAAVGVVVRRQRRRQRRLEELAAHLERERDRRERAAVADERVRIARELHDLVAHAISVIALQADAGEAALERDPDLARRPLATIRDSAGQALTEMRRLLGVLRADEADAGLEPLPGLVRLPALLDRARDGGQAVELAVDGTPVALPPSLDLSAYRIVQEALTNAVKHAPGAPVTVGLRWCPDALEIDVCDRGPGAHGVPSPDAHGLVGMRERVRIHGGELRAGNEAAGGFAVRARLPIGAA